MLNGIRVAIAVDHSVSRKSLRRMLEDQRCAIVAEAGTGPAAIQMVDAHRPDVVLMDPLLPLLDGLEATRVITSKHPQIKVIVYSLLSTDGIRSKALEAGAWHVVSKDRYIRGLISIIRRCREASPRDHQQSCMKPARIAAVG